MLVKLLITLFIKTQKKSKRFVNVDTENWTDVQNIPEQN